MELLFGTKINVSCCISSFIYTFFISYYVAYSTILKIMLNKDLNVFVHVSVCLIEFYAFYLYRLISSVLLFRLLIDKKHERREHPVLVFLNMNKSPKYFSIWIGNAHYYMPQQISCRMNTFWTEMFLNKKTKQCWPFAKTGRTSFEHA